jgi:hypothetical protein
MSNDSAKQKYSLRTDVDRPILPSACSGKKYYPHSPILSDAQTGAPTSTYAAFYEDGSQSFDYSELEYEANAFDDSSLGLLPSSFSAPSNAVKKRDWLLRMNRKLKETDVGTLDPSRIPIHAVMIIEARASLTIIIMNKARASLTIIIIEARASLTIIILNKARASLTIIIIEARASLTIMIIKGFGS